MRVLFFNYEYPPLGGGAANATEQLFHEFAGREDVTIDLITSALGDELEIIDFSERITIYRIPIGKNEENLNYQSQKELFTYAWRALLFARTLIKKHAYDMTHSFFAVPCGAISLYFRTFWGIPYVVSLRGADVPGYSERFTLIYRFITPLIRLIWSRAHTVVTNSNGLTTLAQKSAPRQVFREIYNGIDTDYFTPSGRSEMHPDQEFVILCAARLTYRKGFQDAIDGLALLVDQYPQLRMIIAGGDGGMMRRLKGQAQALSVRDRITFTGRYDKSEAPKIYAQADIFLMPSLNEGMSNNALEALASGLPILMTSTGGARELVEDGVNGFLINFRSGEDIAQKVERLLSEDGLCSQMGHASRERALTLTWTAAADQYRDLYSLIAKKQ